MSKADQLIEAFWHKEEYLREAAMYYPAESGSRRTLLEVADLIAHFRDAVNEKPHEPIKDAGAALSHRPSDGSQTSVPASPPHAAAEPEKPVAWYMPIGGRHSIIEWESKRPDRVGVLEWRPLYAAVPQPIAREPTDEMIEAGESFLHIEHRPKALGNIWRAMYDAAIKSAP